MQANFNALYSRVDGGTSISWKFLNTLLLLVDCYCQEGFAPAPPIYGPNFATSELAATINV